MTKPTLRDDQVADLVFLMRNPKGLLLNDPGTGKTPTACVYMQYLKTKLGVGTCWSMPKSLMDKNREEILRFTDFDSESIEIVDGKKFTPGKSIYLMGFDRFASTWYDLPSDIRCHGVDELHMGFGGPTSQRTQQFLDCGADWPYFFGMTGTLVNGRLDSAWPAIQVIEPRYYGDHRSFYHYHAEEDDWTGRLIGWRNHEKISKILSRHAVRHTFEEIYGPEAKIQFTESSRMSPRQRKAYEDFEADAVLELDNFFVDGTEPGVAFIRARQIMEHPNRFPDLMEPGKYVDITPGEVPGKELLLQVHLEDHARTGKPLVVFSCMIPQQERVLAMCQKMGLNAAVMNTNTSLGERKRIDNGFRDGYIQIVICSTEIAGVGYNWQDLGGKELDHMIFMTLGYKDTSFFQGYRRAMRGVRKTALRITIMEYYNSLDQRIFSILERKAEDANKVDPTRKLLKLRG